MNGLTFTQHKFSFARTAKLLLRKRRALVYVYVMIWVLWFFCLVKGPETMKMIEFYCCVSLSFFAFPLLAHWLPDGNFG